MPRSDRQPIVELEIGGTAVPCNQYLQSFELNRNVGIRTGTLILFDPEWTALEALALEKGFGTILRFKYGWEDQMTEWVTGRLKSYKPEFSNDGVGITIEWIFGSAVKAIRTKQNIMYKEGKKISDIVKEIASRNGWKAEVEDTVGTFDMPFVQGSVNDYYFIEHVLAPRAINSDGVGGYHASLEDDKLIFKTNVVRNRSIYKTYIVQRGIDGEVISFAPFDNVAVIAQMGGAKIKVVTLDPVTKKINTSEAGVDQQSSLVDDGGKISQVVFDEDRVKDYIKVCKPFRRKEDGDNYAKVKVSEFGQWMYQADAEILGDPNIPVWGFVEFIVVTSTGLVHYLSGVYQVYEVKDQIKSGSFITSLVLRRMSVSKGSDNIKAVAQNLIKAPVRTGIVTVEAEVTK